MTSSERVPFAQLVAAATVAVVLAAGCGRGGHKENPILASYRGGQIRADEVRSQLAAMPEPLRRKYESAEGRKQLLDRVLDERLLVEEAERQGLDRHPTVARGRRQQLIALLVEKDTSSPAMVTHREEQARRYYEQHYAEFHQQPQVTILDLTVERRHLGSVKLELARARRAVQAGAPTIATWVGLTERWIREGRVSSREVGPFGEHAPGAPVPLPLAAAARELREPYQLSDPLEISGTFHVVQLKRRQPGRAAPFASVRQQILHRISQRDEQDRTGRLAQQLRERGNVQIDVSALQALQLSSAAAAVTR